MDSGARKKVLVTGGLGFIGSFIADELVGRGHQVRVFDNVDPQVHPDRKIPDYFNRDAEFIEGDVRDYDTLKRAMKDVEIIFHEAAVVGVEQSEYEIKKYVDVNLGGTGNLLDILVRYCHNVEKVVVASSMSIYGEGACECINCGIARPMLRTERKLREGDWENRCSRCSEPVVPIAIKEETVRNPGSIYGHTKMAQEDMALNIGITYGIPVVALRYFNVYGPRQSLANPYTGVAAIFISRIKKHKPPVVYEDGMQMRDFVSVHDVLKANMLAMGRDEANYQVFNVGSGRPIRIKTVAEVLARLYGKDIQPQITNTYRKGDIRHCFADIGRIKSTLGFVPTVPFEEGMEELVKWSRDVTAI